MLPDSDSNASSETCFTTAVRRPTCRTGCPALQRGCLACQSPARRAEATFAEPEWVHFAVVVPFSSCLAKVPRKGEASCRCVQCNQTAPPAYLHENHAALNKSILLVMRLCRCGRSKRVGRGLQGWATASVAACLVTNREP